MNKVINITVIKKYGLEIIEIRLSELKALPNYAKIFTYYFILLCYQIHPIILTDFSYYYFDYFDYIFTLYRRINENK